MTDPEPNPSASSGVFGGRGPWLALAAALIVLVSIAWLFSPFRRQATAVVDRQEPERQALSAPGTTTTSPTPRMFALAVSPVSVRSASDNAVTVIPPDIDVLGVRLQTDGENRQLTATRAAIRTISGDSVWDGAVVADSALPAGTLARIDVPAATLPADDYLITLYGTDGSGAEVEWTQYFLHVRSR
jgi:hypothetical protein